MNDCAGKSTPRLLAVCLPTLLVLFCFPVHAEEAPRSLKQPQTIEAAGLESDLIAGLGVGSPASSRGIPVSHEEAGVTEAQYLAELKAYVETLGEPSISPEGEGPLAQEGVRHVVFYYPYALYTGGAPAFQRNILETLLKTHRNLTLDLAYLNFGHEPSTWHLEDPVRNNRLTGHGIPNKDPGGGEVAKAKLAGDLKGVLHRIHQAGPIDLMVNNNSTHLYEMSVAMLEFAQQERIPTHLYFHGGQITEGVRYLMQHCDGAATNSNAFGKIFSQLGVETEVLHPLSDLSFFFSPLTDADQAAMDRWIERYGLQGKKILLHPARLYPLKGQEDVISAAQILRSRYPQLADPTAWVIVGPPRDVGEKQRLRRLAKEKGVEILFVGKQTREEIRRWYRLAYVVLYPTRGDEPFGLVTVEAQAAGAPVVVTNVGGLPETLMEGKTGLVVGRQNPEHLAEAIAYLVGDPLRRDQMAQAASRYARERYPPQETLARFTDSYLKAVRSRRASPGSGPLPAPPSEPGKVLFDLYDHRHASGLKPVRAHEAVVDQWKQAWFTRLNRAQPHWKPHPDLPFPFSEGTRPAYDPARISSRPLGPYQRLRMPDIPGRGSMSVTRQSPQLNTGQSNLMTLLEKGFLMDDPFSEDLALVSNGYPKVLYDSLLLSRDWQPQWLTPQAIHSQIEWARRGVVSEFHHTEVFVDHLHLHLLAPDTAPVASFSGSFVSEEEWSGVAMGRLGYPVPHIALASSDPDALKKATFLLAEQLEREDRRFSQTVLHAAQGDRVIVLFHVWKGFPKSFGFSPVGFVKVSSEEMPDGLIQGELDRIFLGVEELGRLRTSFWSRWKAGTAQPPPTAGLEASADFHPVAASAKPTVERIPLQGAAQKIVDDPSATHVALPKPIAKTFPLGSYRDNALGLQGMLNHVARHWRVDHFFLSRSETQLFVSVEKPPGAVAMKEFRSPERFVDRNHEIRVKVLTRSARQFLIQLADAQPTHIRLPIRAPLTLLVKLEEEWNELWGRVVGAGGIGSAAGQRILEGARPDPQRKGWVEVGGLRLDSRIILFDTAGHPSKWERAGVIVPFKVDSQKQHVHLRFEEMPAVQIDVARKPTAGLEGGSSDQRLKAVVKRAIKHRERGEYGEEARAWSEAIARQGLQSPNNVGFLISRATAYMNLGQLEKAEADLKQAVQLGAKHPPIHMRLAQVYIKQSRLVEAEAEFGKIIELNGPDSSANVGVFIQRARIRDERGDLRGALADLNEAIKLNPTEKLFLRRAEIYRWLGGLDDLVAEDEKEASRVRREGEIKKNVTMAAQLERAGQLPHAERAWTLAIEEVGDDTDRLIGLYVRRAKLRMKQRKYAEAEEDWSWVIQQKMKAGLGKKEAGFFLERAQARAVQGKREEMEQDLSEAASLRPHQLDRYRSESIRRLAQPHGGAGLSLAAGMKLEATAVDAEPFARLSVDRELPLEGSVELAVHAGLWRRIRAGAFQEFPAEACRLVPEDAEGAARALADFTEKEGTERFILLDRSRLSPEEVPALLPDGHAPVFLMDEESAGLLSPAAIATLLSFKETEPDFFGSVGAATKIYDLELRWEGEDLLLRLA